jgi:transposase
MPCIENIIGLPDFEILSVDQGKKVRFNVKYTGAVCCPYCESQVLRRKDSFLRIVRHFLVGQKLSELCIKASKFKCLSCGKYFNQRFPGVLPRKRASEPFRKQVAQQHHDGIAQHTLAHRLFLGTATIERWYQDFLKLEAAKLEGAACPKVLGIDEHFFSRKKGFATTLVDLKTRRVFDVMLGRSEKSLQGKLDALPLKENVKVVVMDLCETYRSIARKHFPRALVVADRFHVIRLINQHFLNTWKQLDPEGRKNRGLLSLMRRHSWNLKPHQLPRLANYLESLPGLKAVYDFKDELVQLLLNKHRTAKQCKNLIPRFLEMIAELQASPFESLKVLGNSLYSWRSEIARMWRFTVHHLSATS